MSVTKQEYGKDAFVPLEKLRIIQHVDDIKSANPADIALDADAEAEATRGSNLDSYLELSPPPNGGFHAWLQVAGSWFLFFNGWGTVNAFGVFQTYYEDNPYWTRSPSEISWIGSIQAFLLLLVGIFSGPLYDAGYFRHLVCAGTILVPLGFIMTSLCRTYWQTMLAQAVVVGIGSGCLFVPSVAILPQYFSTRKALANGIAASGSSVGGIIFPIMFRRLEQRVGFSWATRSISFVALGGLLFSLCVMKPRYLPQGRRKMTQLSAFKEAPYVLFNLAIFFCMTGFYAPIYYIQTFAISKAITNVSLGFYLLPILNTASIPGRILPNFIADYVGPLNVLTPAALASCILAFGWIGVHEVKGTIAFCILYGFVSGAMVSLPPLAVVSLTKDMRYLGTRMGQTFFVSSFGLLIGSPVAGAIYTRTGSFLGLQLFAATMILLTVICLALARFAAVGSSLKRRA